MSFALWCKLRGWRKQRLWPWSGGPPSQLPGGQVCIFKEPFLPHPGNSTGSHLSRAGAEKKVKYQPALKVRTRRFSKFPNPHVRRATETPTKASRVVWTGEITATGSHVTQLCPNSLSRQSTIRSCRLLWRAPLRSTLSALDSPVLLRPPKEGQSSRWRTKRQADLRRPVRR